MHLDRTTRKITLSLAERASIDTTSVSRDKELRLRTDIACTHASRAGDDRKVSQLYNYFRHEAVHLLGMSGYG